MIRWKLNELASPPESCQIGFRISPRTIGPRMNRNRGLHWNIAAAMAFLAKRRINNDTPEWCRPGGVRILETIHDMTEAACDGAFSGTLIPASRKKKDFCNLDTIFCSTISVIIKISPSFQKRMTEIFRPAYSCSNQSAISWISISS